MAAQSMKGSACAKRNARNTALLATWTGAWVVTMAIANFGPPFLWDGHDAASLIAILINLGAGVGMILANRRFINGLDELQRRIQLEAMAISLGVVLVGGLAYANLDATNLIPFDAEIGSIAILMSVSYMVSLFFAHRRYG